MGKYDAQAGTALKLITKKGAALTVIRSSGSGFDPVTQTDTPLETSYSIKGVGLPAGKSAEFRIGSLEGRNVTEFYFARGSIDPAPGDEVQFQGHRWKIVWSTTYDPAGDGSILTQAYAQR